MEWRRVDGTVEMEQGVAVGERAGRSRFGRESCPHRGLSRLRRARAGSSARMGRRVWVAGASTLALVLVAAGPAWGLAGRGHVFAGAFAGSGEHKLQDPAGVAVDEASGDVYVVDRAPPHERVERFRPAAGGGYVFVSSFNVRSPEGIAVDNSRDTGDPSRGDVYVVGGEEEGVGSEEDDVLYKYSPSAGRVLFKKTVFHARGAGRTGVGRHQRGGGRRERRLVGVLG